MRHTGVVIGIAVIIALVWWAQHGPRRTEDLAWNRPATASSTAFLPAQAAFAVDGEEDTFWHAAGDGPQSLTVDLGGPCAITGVTLSSPAGAADPAEAHPAALENKWYTGKEIPSSYATSYALSFSDDGITWREAFRTDSGKGGAETLPMEATRARYVRVAAAAYSGTEGWAVSELRVLGYPLSKNRPAPQGWTVPPPPLTPEKAAPLAQTPDGGLSLNGRWDLAEDAPGFSGADLSAARPRLGPLKGAWYPATVPGTVLGALVDAGRFPNPLYGLNNLQIPEALGHHAWWYRRSFLYPEGAAKGPVLLGLDGANYGAEVWLNGQRVGDVRGAFRRGRFDVAPLLHAGENVIAVRIDPLKWTGLPFEQNAVDGAGKNGGETTRNGPTFSCTVGWDWIPGIRDRDIGLWDRAFLRPTGAVRIGDAQVVSHLPLPALAPARLTVRAEVRNASAAPQSGRLEARVEGLPFVLAEPVLLSPGETRTVEFDPAKFPQLVLEKPRLWWPNGYGPQELYTLHLSFLADGAPTDTVDVPFGIREITYHEPALSPASARFEARFSPAARATSASSTCRAGPAPGWSWAPSRSSAPAAGKTWPFTRRPPAPCRAATR